MGLLERVSAEVVRAGEARRGFQWPYPSQGFESFNYGGQQYFGVASLGASSPDREPPLAGFAQMVDGPFRGNAVVFACELKRLSIFSEARFIWRGFNKGLPGRLFSTPELGILERPWSRGTTGDLLAEMLVYADIGGNGFVARTMENPDRLRVMRPDWVTIVMGDSSGRPVETAAQLDAEILGFIYAPQDGTTEPEALLAEEVCHFVPPGLRDPLARFRGMSWLTPVIREVQADQAATMHKLAFFENGATPQLVVSFDASVTKEQFQSFVMKMDDAHAGWRNAYKCLHPETTVAMWDGTRRRVDVIEVGDLVVAWSDGRAVPGTVAAVEWQPPSPIVTVTTQRGRVIKTNDRHPFLLRDGSWVDAIDLNYGDLLTTGLGWAADDANDVITPYESWVLGVIVGDGCTISTTPVVSAWDEGIRTRLSIGHTLNSTGKGHDYRLLGVRALCVAAGVMGKRSWEKRIPDQVMTGSSKVKAAFLSGLIDTDGHVTDPNLRRSAEVGITSTSKDLLTDAQHLLASLGVNASVSLSMPGWRAGGGGGGTGARVRDAWRLIALGNDQARRLCSMLDLACAEKARRLAIYAMTPSRQDRSRYDRVVSVEVGPAEPTIGIEIADHHTHVTGGVVTHNTLYLGGGANTEVVGKDLHQLDFAATQGKGETRIIAAAGLHPVLVPSSEGMQGSSLNAGNYAAARRSTADTTFRPLWRNAAGSLAAIVPPPSGSELWYLEQFIPFLREDASDAAKIEQIKAETITKLVREGFTAESATAAVLAQDMSLLEHTGLVSVQLQAPGTAPATARELMPASTNGNGGGPDG